MISVFTKKSPQTVGGSGDGKSIETAYYWSNLATGNDKTHANGISGHPFNVGERVYIKVDLTAGTSYRIHFVNDWEYDTYIWLYDSDGNLVAENDNYDYDEIEENYGESLIEFTPDESGEFIVAVGSWGDEEAGPVGSLTCTPAPNEVQVPEPALVYKTSSGFNAMGKPIKYRSARSAQLIAPEASKDAAEEAFHVSLTSPATISESGHALYHLSEADSDFSSEIYTEILGVKCAAMHYRTYPIAADTQSPIQREQPQTYVAHVFVVDKSISNTKYLSNIYILSDAKYNPMASVSIGAEKIYAGVESSIGAAAELSGAWHQIAYIVHEASGNEVGIDEILVDGVSVTRGTWLKGAEPGYRFVVKSNGNAGAINAVKDVYYFPRALEKRELSLLAAKAFAGMNNNLAFGLDCEHVLPFNMAGKFVTYTGGTPTIENGYLQLPWGCKLTSEVRKPDLDFISDEDIDIEFSIRNGEAKFPVAEAESGSDFKGSVQITGTLFSVGNMTCTLELDSTNGGKVKIYVTDINGVQALAYSQEMLPRICQNKDETGSAIIGIDGTITITDNLTAGSFDPGDAVITFGQLTAITYDGAKIISHPTIELRKFILKCF